MKTNAKVAVWSLGLAVALNLSARAQEGDVVAEVRTSTTVEAQSIELTDVEETTRLLLEEFREKAAEYAAQQKEFQNLKEREQIREAMKANREAFKSARAEFRDGVKELTETLRAQARKIAEERKEQARQNRGRE